MPILTPSPFLLFPPLPPHPEPATERLVHTVLQEEMKDMINTNEENERKHHHLETNATNAVHAKTMGKASKH